MRTGILAALGLCGVVALAAGGCGGGGTGGGAEPTAGPQVQGKVVSRNGQPLLLDGVEVECLNDGVTVTTGEDGSFTIEVPGGVVVRVRFTDPTDVGGLPNLPSCGEEGDDTPDEADVDDDVVEIGPLKDGDVCVIEIEIAGGRVIECGMDLPPFDGNGGIFHGEGVLIPLAPSAEHPASGEVEVEVNGDCASLEVEAVGLEPGATYDVALVDPTLEQLVVGTMTADEHGAAHLSLEGCAGDELPFGVASLTDLAGYGVLVLGADDVPVLAGQVPGHGHEFGEPGDGTDLPDFPGFPGLPGDGGLPGLPPLDPNNLPTDYDELIDLLNGYLGDNPFGFPGFGG